MALSVLVDLDFLGRLLRLRRLREVEDESEVTLAGRFFEEATASLESVMMVIEELGQVAIDSFAGLRMEGG